MIDQQVLFFEQDLGVRGPACAVMQRGGDGDRYGVAWDPTIDRFTYELVLDWATRVCANMALHGPELDGWKQEDGDGVWRLWADLTPLPQLEQPQGER